MRVTAIKVRRVERGLLQLELSAAAGVDRSRLSMIENGWKQPSDDEIRRIAAALNTPVDALRGLGAVENKPPRRSPVTNCVTADEAEVVWWIARMQLGRKLSPL